MTTRMIDEKSNPDIAETPPSAPEPVPEMNPDVAPDADTQQSGMSAAEAESAQPSSEMPAALAMSLTAIAT